MDSTGDPRLVLGETTLDEPDAGAALSSYFAELASSFPEGFDVDAALAELPAILGPPRGAFFLARVDGDVVGCGGLTFLDDGRAELRRMWIRPASRGRGLGAALLRALEEVATRRGSRAIVLDTHASLGAAVALYRAAGYVEIPPYNDNRNAHFWFSKALGADPTTAGVSGRGEHA